MLDLLIFVPLIHDTVSTCGPHTSSLPQMQLCSNDSSAFTLIATAFFIPCNRFLHPVVTHAGLAFCKGLIELHGLAEVKAQYGDLGSTFFYSCRETYKSPSV